MSIQDVNWDPACPELYPVKAAPAFVEKEKTGGPSRGRKSPLPEANKMARSLRSGRTVSEIAVKYGISPRVITQRLRQSGWDPVTGAQVGTAREKGTPLNRRGEGQGQSCHHVGGGDNPNVVPRGPVVHRHVPPAVAVVWPRRPEPEPEALRRAPRVYEITGDNHHRTKLTAAMRIDIASRYLDGEPSTVLAREYGVSERTIRLSLRRMDIPMRTRAETVALRHRQRSERQATSGFTQASSTDVA